VLRISGGIIRLSPQQLQILEVRTQINKEEGIPDIDLRTGQHFVIIEVKSEADVTADQIHRYRRILDQSEIPSKGLVLLTRYPVQIEGADHYLRWYQVAEWIDFESHKYHFKPVSRFLVDQFLGLLKARNMTMSQVTWEMTTGVRSLKTLADMLYEAASACGIKAYIEGTRNHMVIYIDDRLYWAGIEYDQPESFAFGTYNASVDKESADQLGIGTSFVWSKGDGCGWRRDINLESEDIHFFARSKASQMQFLEQFLRESYEIAKQLTLKGDASKPSETEENVDII